MISIYLSNHGYNYVAKWHVLGECWHGFLNRIVFRFNQIFTRFNQQDLFFFCTHIILLRPSHFSLDIRSYQLGVELTSSQVTFYGVITYLSRKYERACLNKMR